MEWHEIAPWMIDVNDGCHRPNAKINSFIFVLISLTSLVSM